jgi:DNA repair protein RecO (recombination protein O)
MHQTSQAVILKKIAYGEADLIVTFFGREEGRLSGIAKSAKASQRRFGGALELGSLVELRYIHRRASDLVRIEDAHIIMPTTGIMTSLEKLGSLSRTLELALAFLPERQAAPEKFDLLSRYIAYLSKNNPSAESQIIFELRWLSLVGYKPVLDKCSVCGCPTEEKRSWSFSFDHGGVLCHKCVRPNLRRAGLKHESVKDMRILAGGGTGRLDRAGSRAIEGVLSDYVEHLLGRPLTGRSIAGHF